MSTTWATAWKTTEDRITGWIANEIGYTLDQQIFAGELPKDFQYSDDAGVCLFRIQGGGPPISFEWNMNTPGAASQREMGCEFHGVFSTREEAMTVAGALMDVIPPAESAIQGVDRLRPTEEPTIERTTIPRRSDQALGGEMRVWAITYPMLVLFTRTEAP